MNSLTELRFAADHPAFAGHFPGMPIVPGVLLLDEVLSAIAAQAGVELAQCTLGTVKFRNLVLPEQVLQLRCVSTVPGQVRFTIESAGQVAVEGSVAFQAAGGDQP